MWGRKDRDELYQDYLDSEGSILGTMDKEEWDRIQDQAEEISSGVASGLFNRDERVWQRVSEIQDDES